MKTMRDMTRQNGFTLVEVAIVLLIVTLLLGYTMAMFPVQQELKQYRRAHRQIQEIKQALVGYAQINGRLPCPALPGSGGREDLDPGNNNNCSRYYGFVPATTLGLSGALNEDRLLLDPWGNPYRYAVASSDDDRDGFADFVQAGEMKDIGLVDSDTPPDGYIDLDGNLMVCASASSSNDDCSANDYIVGDPDGNTPHDAYAGAPAVVLSLGKNGANATSADELENRGNRYIVANLGATAGPSGRDYYIDTDTVFAKPNGQREDFDDLVDWVSSNLLFSSMIEADQLP